MTATAPAIPVRLNMCLAILFAALGVAQLIFLPLIFLPTETAWGWLLVPLTALTATNWALIHEAIHGVLHPKAAVNAALGRGLSVLFGGSFQLLRLGHLMHHRFNRSALDSTEVAAKPSMRQTGVYYARLLGGLYGTEFLANLAAFLPKRLVEKLVRAFFGEEAADGRTMHHAARQHLLEGPGLLALRVEGALVTALYGTALWLYGDMWWMLALALAGRAFLISFFDNSYHYGTPLDAVLYAYNLRLPVWVSRGLLNFNLHAVHHQKPSLPWTYLRDSFIKEGHTYEGGYLRVALRQLRGPLTPESLALAPGTRGLNAAE